MTVVAFTVYGLCFLVYHFVYLWLTRARPSLTKKGRINECVSSWLEGTRGEKQYLLIVHQLRNMIMSITFLASASILLVGFLLTYGLTDLTGSGSGVFSGSINYPEWLAFFTLAYSFLNLLMALRHLNNLSILVRSSPGKLEKIEASGSSEYLEKLFLKGSRRYMMGRRGFLYAVVTFFWYLDVRVFISLVLLLTVTLSLNHDF